MKTDHSELLVHHQNLLRGAIAQHNRRVRSDLKHPMLIRTKLRRTLQEIKKTLPRDQRQAFFDWFGRLIDGMGPQLYATLGRDLTTGLPATDGTSLSSELDWIRYRLAPHLADLQRLLAKSEKLNESVWAADHSQSSAIIAEMREISGASLWLLEAEVALKQEFEGLDAQKGIRDETRKTYGGGLPSYLAFFYSIRNEERSTFALFADDFRQTIISSYKEESSRNYLNYKILGDVARSEAVIASMLQLEQRQSFLDIYETSIDLLQHAVSKIPAATWSQSAVRLLRSLESLNDWRVDKLLFALTGEAIMDRGNPDVARGFSEAVADNFWSHIEDLTSIDDFRATALTEMERIVADLLIAVMYRTESFEESRGRLTKLSKNFSFTPAAKALGALVELLTISSEPGDRAQVYASLNNRNQSKHEMLAAPPDVLQETIASFPAPGSDLRSWLATEPPSRTALLDPIGWYLYALKISERDPFSALEVLEAFETQAFHEPLSILIRNLRIQLCLEAGEWKKSVSLMGFEVAKSATALSIMPVRAALDGRDWPSLNSIDDKLDLALCLYALWKSTDDSHHATYLRFAFEEVLFQLEYQLPSEIPVEVVSANPCVQFFLHYVCIPTIMDSSGFFATSAELQTEREKILRNLIAANFCDSKTFEDELAAINASRLIKSGLQIVDSNRVTVETSALSRWAQRKYRQSYSRYLALKGSATGPSVKFDDIMAEITAAADASGEYFSIPKSEADNLLLEMILGIKEEFLENQQYGLEYFLGKRIRHGTIAGHLRGAAEASKIITERRSASAPYEPNSYWLDRIPTANDGSRAEISTAFDDFSEKYDNMISDVRDRILHVKSKSYPDGLFEITITAPHFHLIKGVVAGDIDFETFLYVCINIFWSLLAPSLVKANQFLKSTVKSDAIMLLAGLQTSLVRATGSSECCQSVSIAIQNVTTEVQRELDTVASWFERAESRGIAKFSFEDAIEIAIRAVLNTHTTFRPTFDRNIQSSLVATQGILLVIWEFVFTVLDNVYRRARVGDTPKLVLDCQLHEAERRLLLRIVNPVGDLVDLKSIQHRLVLTRQKIAAGDIAGGAAADKNSGLLKMASVARDFPPAKFRFQLDEDSREFTTELELPVYIVNESVTLPMDKAE